MDLLWTLLFLAALLLGTTVYGTSGQSITITIASLAQNALRESTAITQTAAGDADGIMVGLKIKTGATAAGYVVVYLYGSCDGGSNYSGSCTGSDAAYTGNSNNLIRLGVIDTPTSATTYRANFVIDRAAGGVPEKWGIVLENKNGAALDSTAGNHGAWYQEVTLQ